MIILRSAYVLPLLLALGCFGSTAPIDGDAGSVDSSFPPDVTRVDAGPPQMDGGPPRVDSGPPPQMDGGPPRVDGGPPRVDGGPARVDAGPPLPTLEVACASLCDAGAACGFGEPSDCTMGCLGFGRTSPTCEAAIIPFFECNLSLDCMSLLTAFEDGRAGPCGMEFVAVEEECFIPPAE